VQGDKGSPAPGAGTLGLAVFLVSLSVLFVSGVVAYLIVRSRAEVWPPATAPELPAGLWLSTLLLVGCSASIQLGLGAIRRGEERKLLVYLAATLGWSLLFCVSQAWNWQRFWAADTGFHDNLYGFGFFMLTGLHAAHVLGGILAMVVVTLRAALGHYSWAYYPGVRYTATYWHFLGFTWLAILTVLHLDH
jgi:cytochrome c oxidase subunit 3